MVALSRTLFAMLATFLLLAAILIGGSIGGFLGSGYMIASAVLVIVLWGVFAGLAINAIRLANAVARGGGSLTQALLWANRLFLTVIILSAVTGLALAFLAFVGCGPLWLSSLYHWGGMVGTILGFLAFFLLPVIVRACVGETDGYATFHRWWWVVFMPLAVASLWALAWLIPYLILRGDVNESEYQASDRIYQLPFPGGESTWVIQGNNSSLNHNNAHNGQKFSWDFRRRCGTPVLAARDGTIQTAPVVTNDGMGGTNNQIQVDHGDGTVASYLHIQKESVPARLRVIGATVRRGDEIAKVGSVGNSMTGHIHFMVKRGASTIGVSFTDVSDDKGIPRTFHSYTSGNRRVP
jgi:Peptidase family M23